MNLYQQWARVERKKWGANNKLRSIFKELSLFLSSTFYLYSILMFDIFFLLINYGMFDNNYVCAIIFL